MPRLTDYDGIELALPDFADWLDLELVGAKGGQTYNVTPAQIAIVAQDGMADEDHTHPISEVTGLQAALDTKITYAVSTDANNVITAGADGKAFLSGDLLLPDGPDLAAYATIVYVNAQIAAQDFSAYATAASVAALEATVTDGLADVNAALEAL